MKLGMFPGQLEALQQRVEEIRQEEKKRGSRRAFLALVAGGALGAGGASVALGHTGAQPQTPMAELPAELEWARKLALAPDDELLAKHALFLQAASKSSPGEHLIWHGVTRLARAVRERRPDAPRALSPALEVLMERANVPDHARQCCQALLARPR